MESLIGREAELGRLRHAVAPGRLVVVSGPPGVGKTALVRAALGGRDRVVWVDLDDARTPNDLWAALGRALGTSLTDPSRAREQVAWALRDVAVVMLDGAELLDEPAWAALDQLRRDRPEVAWIVAAVVSRAGASAELQLAPLPVEQARELLVARATARSLTRAVDPADPAWSTLAERLDGLPLALELAAGRLSLMSPKELVDRLEVAVVRGADRRTSVEGALRFAWDLLGSADRTALVRLSLARGFTLPVAEGLLGDDALGALERLRARSAVALRDGRLFVLEGLRQIAAEHVDDATRAGFVSFWARYGVELRKRAGAADVDAARALRDEQANLNTALEIARSSGSLAEAAPIARAVLLSLRLHGPLWRVEELPDLLPLAEAVGGEAGADLLAALGGGLMQLGRTRVGREVLERALALAAPLGPVSGALSAAFAELGWLEIIESKLDAAREALNLALRAAPDGPTAALALNRLATVDQIAGDHEAAVRDLEEALARLESTPTHRLRGALRLNLGLLRAEEGRRIEAEDLLRGAAEELADLDLQGHGTAVQDLALLALAYGDTEAAAPLIGEAYQLHERHGGDVTRGNAALGCALERWCAGDRSGARERLVEAADRVRGVDRIAEALVRAWRAALEADGGHPGSLAVELEAARADGLDPALVEVLLAFGGGSPPPPAPIESLEIRIARRLLDRGPPALRCDRAGRWFERPGDRVDLARRGALRRILGALVEARVTRPGAGLSVQELFEAGWPGDRALPDAAAARVYTAIRELRALGVGEVLRREAQGYLLDPAARIDVQA